MAVRRYAGDGNDGCAGIRRFVGESHTSEPDSGGYGWNRSARATPREQRCGDDTAIPARGGYVSGVRANGVAFGVRRGGYDGGDGRRWSATIPAGGVHSAVIANVAARDLACGGVQAL